MLEVGAEGGVIEGALRLEEGAGEAFFLKRILGGNSVEMYEKKSSFESHL